MFCSSTNSIDPIWNEHEQWRKNYSPQIISPSMSTKSELFSNFASKQQNRNLSSLNFSKIDETDFNGSIKTVSKQLSIDVFNNMLQIIFPSPYLKMKELKSLYEQDDILIKRSTSYPEKCKLDSLLMENNNNEEILDFEQLDLDDSNKSRNDCKQLGKML